MKYKSICLFSFSENYKNRVWKMQVMLKKQEQEEHEKPPPRMTKNEWTAKHAEIVRKNKVSPRYDLSRMFDTSSSYFFSPPNSPDKF